MSDESTCIQDCFCTLVNRKMVGRMRFLCVTGASYRERFRAQPQAREEAAGLGYCIIGFLWVTWAYLAHVISHTTKGMEMTFSQCLLIQWVVIFVFALLITQLWCRLMGEKIEFSSAAKPN